MLHHSNHSSTYLPEMSNGQFEGEVCPSCEQPIPPEKLEEIKGKIAAHDRTQASMVRKQLEERFASALASEINTLREAKDLEISQLNQRAADQAALIRKDAIETTEARLRGEIKSRQDEVAAALDRAKKAELESRLLCDQHTSALLAQRDLLEKSKEDAVSAERAKAFNETQKLSAKVSDLQRALEKKSAEELGEGAELDLFEALKKEFPDDQIMRIAKGTPGADVRHRVMLKGHVCGTILYDSKNHNQFRHDHVSKLRADQLADKAEHALLSTHKFPEGTRQVCVRDGVILANPARVLSLVTIIRQHLMHVHTLRLGAVERESKTEALYEFITSENCSSLLRRIDERASYLLKQQEAEMEWHRRHWKNEGEALRAVQKAKVDLENQISNIVGKSACDTELREAS